MIKEYYNDMPMEGTLGNITSSQIPREDYVKTHEGMILLCHDAFIGYDKGILLVTRKREPAKDYIWSLGGRVSRGVPLEQSLKDKIKLESGLVLKELTFLGEERTIFDNDPFGHGRGTDTFNLAYFARAEGDLVLDGDHRNPRIVKKSDYEELATALHPYVRRFLKSSLELI